MPTALVTGASSGIGQEMARLLAEKKLNLILVARRAERLEHLGEELYRTYGINYHVIPTDLTDRHQVNTLFTLVDEWLELNNERLDVLINNAGSAVWDEFVQQDTEALEAEIDLNVNAVTALAHGFVKRNRDAKHKSYLLNIASLAGIMPVPHFAVYSATKAFVISLSEVLAYELRNTNVSVTCSCPGGVVTEFLEHAGQKQKRDLGMMQADEVAKLSLKAMYKGDTVYIPGGLNKLNSAVRFLPRGMRSRLLEIAMNMTVEPDR